MSNSYLLFLIGFGVTLIFVPAVIRVVRALKAGQNILEYVETHKTKQGTPTMGGIAFLLGLIVCFFVLFDKDSRLNSILLLVTLSFGLLGFLDDFLKIKFKHNEGLKAYQKALGQVGIATIIAIFVYKSGLVNNGILLPNGQVWDIGAWIIPFIIIFYLAVTNSVNLTDGLDGLAGGVSTVFLLGFVLILNIVLGESDLLGAELLQSELKNMSLLVVAFTGCIVGFLCYNWHPASIFMGDTGSLAIGGFIATILTFSNLYLLMFVIGIMFVLNTLSVVLQVGYYKLTKKRIFKMAPLHHHFEKCGIKETKIVFMYIVVTAVVLIFTLLLI